MTCTLCKDVGWVCANHPDKPFTAGREDASVAAAFPARLAIPPMTKSPNRNVTAGRLTRRAIKSNGLI